MTAPPPDLLTVFYGLGAVLTLASLVGFASPASFFA